MKVRKLKFGFEISDIDYSSVHHAQFIKEKIGDGRFVVLKNNRHIHPDTVANLYRNIGSLAVQPEEVKSALSENRAFCKVTSKDMFHGGTDGELSWHNAIGNRPVGDEIICMYMQKNNCKGGDTGFTDFQQAYDDLSNDQKAYWESKYSRYRLYKFDGKTEEELTKQVENSYFAPMYKNVKESIYFIDADGESAITRQVEHINVITKHPINNKKGFYFPFHIVKGFKGYSESTGRDMIQKLVKYLLQDKYVYWHKWDLHDIVLSDQIHSLHKRDPYTGDRELWRSGIMLN